MNSRALIEAEDPKHFLRVISKNFTWQTREGHPEIQDAWAQGENYLAGATLQTLDMHWGTTLHMSTTADLAVYAEGDTFAQHRIGRSANWNSFYIRKADIEPLKQAIEKFFRETVPWIVQSHEGDPERAEASFVMRWHKVQRPFKLTKEQAMDMMESARSVIDRVVAENIDSYEGGQSTAVDNLRYSEQFPRKPQWHPGHRSSRMSLNRNARRKSFGYTDTPSSLRDRGWPFVNRGYDRRMNKYNRELKKFGSVQPPGEGI